MAKSCCSRQTSSCCCRNSIATITRIFFSNLSKSKHCSVNEYGQRWYLLWVIPLSSAWKLLQTCAAEKQLLQQSRLLPLQTRLDAHTHKPGQSSISFLIGNFEYAQPNAMQSILSIIGIGPYDTFSLCQRLRVAMKRDELQK